MAQQAKSSPISSHAEALLALYAWREQDPSAVQAMDFLARAFRGLGFVDCTATHVECLHDELIEAGFIGMAHP